MKKTKWILLLVAWGGLWSFYGCKLFPDPPAPTPRVPKLPPETQTGKGTFGCKVNGEIWEGFSPDAFISGITNELVVSSLHYSEESSIFLFANNVFEPGVFILGGRVHPTDPEVLENSFTYDSRPDDCFFENDGTYTGRLEVTYRDIDKQIVSGRFEFMFYTTECDTVRVTEGRFDIVYTRS